MRGLGVKSIKNLKDTNVYRDRGLHGWLNSGSNKQRFCLRPSDRRGRTPTFKYMYTDPWALAISDFTSAVFTPAEF